MNYPLPYGNDRQSAMRRLTAEADIPCYVLENGQRVLATSKMQEALGLDNTGGSAKLMRFGGSIALEPFISNDLTVRLNSPIEFIPPRGGHAFGYDPSVLTGTAQRCFPIAAARSPIARFCLVSQNGNYPVLWVFSLLWA
jgi:hypothetical protein